MPTAREIEECCEFRKKHAKEKLKKEQKKEVNKKEEKPTCCGQKDEPCCGNSEAKPPAPKKKRTKSRKKRCDRCPLDLDEAITIIQPTYGNREKYLDVAHIHCVLDAEESARLKKLEEIRAKWRDNIKCAPEEADDEAEADSSGVEGSLEGESDSGEEAENDGDEDPKGKMCAIGTKSNKQSSRREKQTKGKESKEELKNKSACSSICSLDSEIDVSEFALTCEEIRMIDNSH